jgi:hypothetical protein
MNEDYKNRTYDYTLINWNKPQPVLPQRVAKLTKHEAGTLNRALRMNGTTKRYVLNDKQSE